MKTKYAKKRIYFYEKQHKAFKKYTEKIAKRSMSDIVRELVDEFLKKNGVNY